MDNTGEFRCLCCGNCCRWEGLVRITEQETDEIATFINLGAADFIEKYTYLCPDRTGLSLIEKQDGSCIFFDDEKSICIIQPVKPKQCRDFPIFWNFPDWKKECAGGRKLLR